MMSFSLFVKKYFRNLLKIKPEELIFDAIVIGIIYFSNSALRTLLNHFVNSFYHSSNTITAWLIAIITGILIMYVPFFAMSQKQEKKVSDADTFAIVIFWIAWALFFFVIPPMILDGLLKNPLTGNAALGSIFGLLVINIIIAAILLSLIFNFIDNHSKDNKSADRKRVVFGKIYMALIVPQILVFSYLIIAFYEDNLFFLILIGLFRIGYLLSGKINVLNLLVLAVTIYYIFTTGIVA